MRLALILAAIACTACAPPPTPPVRDPPPAQADERPIGVATIDAAGVITLTLRAETPDGRTLGDAQFTYRPGEPEYDNILRHIGPIRPGESRPVPPWPER